MVSCALHIPSNEIARLMLEGFPVVGGTSLRFSETIVQFSFLPAVRESSSEILSL